MGIGDLFSKRSEEEEIELLKKRLNSLKPNHENVFNDEFIEKNEVKIVDEISEPLNQSILPEQMVQIQKNSENKNFNSKFDELISSLKQNTLEETQIEKKISNVESKLNELEKNTSKFILLYEAMMNNVNPFVNKEEKIVSLPLVEKIKKEIHPIVHEENYFILKSGEKLKSIYDLINALEYMSDDVFNHHVSLKHNDFASWINYILKLDDLAKLLGDIKKREETLYLIKGYLEFKK